DGIITITINRPDKLNAINKQVMDDLNRVMDEVINHADIKAAIITGAGTKAFVAGADISEFVGLNVNEGTALARTGQQVFLKIEELLDKVKSILQTILSKAPLAISHCIQAANAVFDKEKNGFDVELKAFGECFGTEDMKEGSTAFLERRKASFKGK